MGVLAETSPINPLTTHAEANRATEEAALALADDACTVVVIRRATVHGLPHRHRFDLAVDGMTKGFHQNGRIPILRDGTQWRSFVHVRDTSRAMIALLSADASVVNGENFNVGISEQNVQIRPLAEMVASAVGLEFDFEWYGEPDHRSYQINFDEIRDAIGCETQLTPSDGTQEIWEALQDGHLRPERPEHDHAEVVPAPVRDARSAGHHGADGTLL